MVGLSEVVSHRVEDEGPADYVVGSVESDLFVGEIDVAELVVVENDIAEVTNVAVLVIGMSMVSLLVLID